MIFDPLLSRCHWKWNHMWFSNDSEPLLQEKLAWIVWAHESPHEKKNKRDLGHPSALPKERGERWTTLCVSGGRTFLLQGSDCVSLFSGPATSIVCCCHCHLTCLAIRLCGQQRLPERLWCVHYSEQTTAHEKLRSGGRWGPIYFHVYSLTLYKLHAKAFHSLALHNLKNNNLLSQAHRNRPLYALNYSQGATCPSSPHLVKS